MDRELIIKYLLILTLVGLLLSIYSWLHNQGFASGEFCAIDETFDCDIVNKGPYGTFLNVPVSLIGVIGYGLLFLASVAKYRTQDDKQLTKFLMLATVGGLSFSFYLTGIEAFVLNAWCVVCLASQTIILLITYLVGKLYLDER